MLEDILGDFLENRWVLLILCLFGIVFLSITIVFLVVHKLLLGIILAIFFTMLEGLMLRLKILKVKAYKWIPLFILIFPIAGFFLGAGLERVGFYVTPLESQPTTPMWAPSAIITNSTLLLLALFLILGTIALLSKRKS